MKPHDDAEFLRLWLAGRDAPCPVCGYNARGLPTAECPECHAPLNLTLASPRSRPAAWFTGAVAVAMGFGFDVVAGALLFAVAIIFAPPTGAARTQAAAYIATFLVLALAGGAALIALYRTRQRWALVPTARQWARGVAIAAVVVLVHAVAGLWMSGRL